jgi:rod shape-determining protein MreB and related proteins
LLKRPATRVFSLLAGIHKLVKKNIENKSGIYENSIFLFHLCKQYNYFFQNFMGLFNWFTQEIAIDLGTANTLIIHNDEVVVNEPSIVALDRNNPKHVLAVGKRALMMHEKTHESIRTVRPLKDGVIADFNAAELMIREMIKMIYPKRKPLFAPSWRMMICIPSSITEVEKRAVRDSAEQAGAKEVYLIHEPMAAALGIGIDVEEPVGNMIVDIGGGTTGITVIALAGIVCDQSIRIAGDEFTADIMEALRRYHSLLIGERTAEQIKIQVGAAMKDLETPPDDIPVNGRDLVTGIPKQIMVSFQEIAEALDKSIFKIEEAILKALETTPPELAADIYRRGIYLTGGGALLRGLDKRLSQKIKLPVHVADDPLKSVVRGTGIALKSYDRYPFVMR